MFGTIRKHQTWLWAVIITVTVISFVAYFNPASRGSGNRSAINYWSIDGNRIAEQDYINAYREAALRFFMSYGTWPDVDAKRLGYDEARETYQRLFFIAKIKEYDITVDSVSVAKAANNILRSIGRGNPVPLDAFTQQVLAPHGMSADDFERYLRHELAIQQLASTIGLAGRLVPPAEADSLFAHEYQPISASAVFFEATNYLSSVPALTPEMISNFYSNHLAEYRIPERIQVSYVQFDATNFLSNADEQIAKITNFNALVEQEYRTRGTNYFKTLSADEAKAKIRAETRHRLALTAALQHANDFGRELDAMEPHRADNIGILAKTNGLALKVSAPFDEENGSSEMDAGPDFAKKAFALTPDDPFAGPLAGSDSVFEIALNKRIPAEYPSLESIRTQVVADCKMNQAVLVARRNGMQFVTTLTNSLAQGKSFSDACKQASVKPTVIPPFSLATDRLPSIEEHLGLDQLKRLAISTPSGKTEGFIPTREGGMVLFVNQRLPLDASSRTNLPAFMNSLHSSRQNEAINAWYIREAQKQEPQVADILLGRTRAKSGAISPGRS